MQSRYPHIFVYPIESREQINNTYNSIVARLQDTIPSQGVVLEPSTPLGIFVSPYVQRLTIKVVHDPNKARSQITIIDAEQNQVTADQEGVQYFNDLDNPVEVIAIGDVRLNKDDNQDGIADLKNAIWRIETDSPVFILLDIRGAYDLNFLEPNVLFNTEARGFITTERHNYLENLSIRFNLIDINNQIITDPQQIQVQVIYPCTSINEQP